MNWYVTVLKKYADFNGRARRTEYWMFALINGLIEVALLIMAFGLAAAMNGNRRSGLAMLVIVPFYLYMFAVLVPGLAVAIRRLHDTGRAGVWVLIAFVPFVGGIILLVFMCQDSQPGSNEFGPNPKGIQGFGQYPPPGIPQY